MTDDPRDIEDALFEMKNLWDNLPIKSTHVMDWHDGRWMICELATGLWTEIPEPTEEPDGN